jgi:hypothetical protein
MDASLWVRSVESYISLEFWGGRQKRGKLDVNVNKEAEDISELTADWEALARATVNCRLCELVTAL